MRCGSNGAGASIGNLNPAFPEIFGRCRNGRLRKVLSNGYPAGNET